MIGHFICILTLVTLMAPYGIFIQNYFIELNEIKNNIIYHNKGLQVIETTHICLIQDQIFANLGV